MKKIYFFIVFCCILIFLTPISQADNKPENNSILKTEQKAKQKIQQQFQDDINMKSPNLLKAKEELENKNINPLKTEKSLLHVVLMYLPNRIIDLTDIVTFGFGFGPEASSEITVTEYFQFSAAYGDRYFIEKGYNRQYGGGYYSGHTVGYVCWKNEISATDFTFGYVEPYVVLQNGYNIPDYKFKPYSNGIRDFWRIGVHLGWIVDLSLNVHPVAIANFFTGFFFIRLTDTEEI